mgnify:CR=1 FL=1
MYTILVIDDDIQILRLCKAFLEREGHTAFQATTGDAGIRVCDNKPIDLVITDIIMPDKDGLETISEIRARFPEIRIVAMSGGGRLGPDNYLPLAKKFGAVRVLSKPFTRDELLAVVNDPVWEKRRSAKSVPIPSAQETSS